MVVVIQEPHLWISWILFERHCEAIGDVEAQIRDLAQQGANHSLSGSLGYPVVVVNDSKEDDWMDDDVPSVLFCVLWLVCLLLFIVLVLVVFAGSNGLAVQRV